MTLAERLAAAMTREATQPFLTGDGRGLEPMGDLADAAVLIAITDRAAPGVILTQRTENLSRHPGQVAFPGGRRDPGDVDATATALREAEEEIALPSARVHVVGTAERYRTGTGFDITPVVGVVPPDLPLVPAEAEVASVFEVPLAFLLDPANLAEGEAMWRGANRRYYEILWQDRRIWGATAGIIVNLSRRLQWA